jgi:hypothetical protein
MKEIAGAESDHESSYKPCASYMSGPIVEHGLSAACDEHTCDKPHYGDDDDKPINGLQDYEWRRRMPNFGVRILQNTASDYHYPDRIASDADALMARLRTMRPITISSLILHET